jgi:hypothetical protein
MHLHYELWGFEDSTRIFGVLSPLGFEAAAAAAACFLLLAFAFLLQFEISKNPDSAIAGPSRRWALVRQCAKRRYVKVAYGFAKYIEIYNMLQYQHPSFILHVRVRSAWLLLLLLCCSFLVLVLFFLEQSMAAHRSLEPGKHPS